jgi:hypothetical protein
MFKDWGSFVTFKMKKVGLWQVELVRYNDGYYGLIMTRSTDCNYNTLSIKFKEDAEHAYNELKRVKDIINYNKNGVLWF